MELANLRDSEDRMRQQNLESTQREKVLVRRLATKEQEMQEYANQIAELKAAQAPGAAALRSALLDPAVNLLLQRLRQELLATRARLEETQNELSAWKFTPDSNTGKRLMAKCRLLYQENEELGRMINSGRLAKLEGDLALQKSFSEEVKKSQSELDEFLQDLDEDVEGMQSTIYYLQQELRKAKDTVNSLQQENTLLKNGTTSTVSEHHEGVADSEVGRKARPRTPAVCHNGVQIKGEEDSGGWEDQTADQAPCTDRNMSPVQSHLHSPSTPATKKSVDVAHAQEEMICSSPSPEDDNVSCEMRTRPRSPQEPDGRTLEESNELVSSQPHNPTASALKREWERTKHQDESSSDSGELILKLEAEDNIGEEEAESRDSNHAEAESKTPKEREPVNVSGIEVEASVKGNSHAEQCSGSLRKRTYPSDDSSGDDSDNVPLIKKVRRDSEISLHYSEDDDDETGLTNGDTSVVGNDGQ